MATKSNLKRIFVTGGHYTPAKAVMDKLGGEPASPAKRGEYEIFYVGRRYAMEDSKALALEYQELRNLSNLRYLSITTGRLQRKFFVNVGQSIKALLKIPVGFLQACWWVIWFRPNLVLSFGGYVAVPVVLAAWLWDIPVLTHEQTQTIGLANRIIRLLGAKVLDVGNPLRPEILTAKPSATNTIFITGGNQGAVVINQAVEKIIDKLTKKYFVIHQTGDYEIKKIKNYLPQKFFNGSEMANNLAKAKIVISRAGANIVSEIAYLGKPAVLIPIPWSGGNEQFKNAQKLAGTGLVEILEQENLTGERLLEIVNKIDRSYKSYVIHAADAGKLVDTDAAKKIAGEVEKLLR